MPPEGRLTLDPAAAGPPDSTRFADAFLFGAATSAYQIEGSPLADGAGASNWHRHTHSPGLTVDGATGDVACDHYHRYAEDVDLMRRLGLQAYRFSLAWGRILPEGTGRVNPAGLGFYERLVDRLLAAGIEPFVTLFHWDLPVALEDRGGWLNPDSPDWFAEYTRVAARALGDRVRFWMTINEPWVVTDGGYLFGTNAPGHRNIFEAPIATHHLLLAHGAGVQAFRSVAKGRIGLVVNLGPKEAASTSPEDVAAAERDDIYLNRQFLDPVFFGRYPDGLAEIFGGAWPAHAEGDLDLARQPIDFIGVNYYTRSVVRHDEAAVPVRARPVPGPGSLYTETGWEVFPDGLLRTLRWVRERYGDIPLYVTENGAAFADPESAAGGRIHDPLRADYLRRHLLAAHAALGEGIDLRGYFVWSLLDNLEWQSGYSKRFGIVHVDFSSQRRTVKDSGWYYRKVIASRGASLALEPSPEDARA